MAQKKGSGTSRNGRDYAGRRLGVKRFDGQVVNAGTSILRQQGAKVRPGINVGCGKDYTLFARISGYVKFCIKKGKNRKSF
ncbi:50S ribosomal protein L27 [Holospora elegans E1]|uniref:Large ribosomal subunit protein bL27 n=1 Tax=Holospora elegans E1 TaxID=1427503 RepID=A0A023DXX6_9PROT|nr:50S ribosomal protein L27 [Holospora elegans]GAJ45800.1 50S ribosomal protein L27 [Holospora elegans E1]